MDVMKALKKLPDESVDMQITSPPYWGLRDYGSDVEVIWDGEEGCEHEFISNQRQNIVGNLAKGDEEVGATAAGVQKFIIKEAFCKKCGAWKGQLGLESDFNLYIKHLVDIFDEVKRVLKKDGTCWINLGDTYSGGNLGVGQPEDWKSISTDNKGAGFDTNTMKDFVKQRNKMDYSAKCLCVIPERFMIEMINRGWILRNKIIWHKPNHMPTSVKDRFANSWEYLFMFSKSKKYYFDLDAVREPHQSETYERNKYGHSGDGKITAIGRKRKPGEFMNPKCKNSDDVISAKFKVGDGYRQGMNRDELELIEVRINLPSQKEFVDKLRENFDIDDIIERTELEKTKVEHWFRYDKDGFSYPSKEDWALVQKAFYSDLFPELLKTELKPNAVIDNPIGKNPSDTWKDNLRDDERAKLARELGMYTFYSHSRRFEPKFKHTEDFWNITTQPYPEAHFAVFPEALVRKPIKTTRKNAVIMDIFAGSGTTLKVARDLHKDSIGIEIKPDYCKLIEKRLFKGNVSLFPNEFKLIKSADFASSRKENEKGQV